MTGASASILIADDDPAIRVVLTQALTRAGHHVRSTGVASDLWRWVESGDGDLVITDVIMPDGDGFDLLLRIRQIRPDLRVIVMSARNTLLTAIKASERGAFEYLPKPFDLSKLTETVTKALAPLLDSAASAATPSPDDPAAEAVPLIGRSPSMQEVYRLMARLIGTDLTVLIIGESGTGKELIARGLHAYGKRRSCPFVAINMAAIPRDLIESELFGHEKGAFTGATSRSAGRFEQARGGTLFLDEIGDMPPEAQTRLLRVLQEGEYMTVGGRQPIRADVRVIAATHRDLRQLIRDGTFREDLYYRLNVVPVRVPSLRERREDIPDLLHHFLQRATEVGLPLKHIDAAAMDILVDYAWPGNVRELENLVKRLAALYSEEQIGAEAIRRELPDPVDPRPGIVTAASETLAEAVDRHLRACFAAHAGALPPAGLHARLLREIERPLIIQTLQATNGNQLRAADLLGLNRNTLRKKIRELDIPVIRSRQ